MTITAARLTAGKRCRQAEAAAAHAELVVLMQQRRGLGLDLASLLTLRHLSRLCSFRCDEPACTGRAIQLEASAAELYAEGQQLCGEEVACLERRIHKLLGQIQFCLEPPTPLATSRAAPPGSSAARA